MKFKLLCLTFTGLISTTALARSAFSDGIVDLKPIVHSASEVAVTNQIPSIHREAKKVISNKEQQKNQEIALTLDDDYDGYDYFNSYDVPVHTQADYERAKKFVESERERQNSGYPVYIPMFYR